VASQVMKPSMVAMLGWIMPEPLAMPPMRTGRPSRRSSRAIDLVTRSVVTMADAAAAEPVEVRAATAWGMPDRRGSILMGWPMTPVEAMRIVSGSMLRAWAVRRAASRVSASPWAPVQALAWPALQRMARAVGLVLRRSRQ
jgi:hypothetical protein